MNYSKTTEGRTTRRTAITVGAIAVTSALMLVLPAIALTTTTIAFAEEHENRECWGTVTSQRATSEGDIGQHASAEEQGTDPRVGIANVLPSHPSELGTFLAENDGIDETECP